MALPILPPYCLVSLGLFKDELVIASNQTANDAILQRFVQRASMVVESFCRRRIVYRGIPDVSTLDNILSGKTIANGNLTPLSAWPTSGPTGILRNIAVSITDASAAMSAGVVKVTGTLAGNVVSESFNFGATAYGNVGSYVYHGVQLFDGITTVNIANLAGTAGTISVGTEQPYLEIHTNPPLTPEASTAAPIVSSGLGTFAYSAGWGTVLPRHPVFKTRDSIWLTERPIVSLASVNEDPTAAFAAATILVQGTDYLLDKDHAEIKRIAGNALNTQIGWAEGVDVIQFIYTAGIKDTPDKSNVPPRIQDVVLRLGAVFYNEWKNKRQGMSGYHDPTGSFTRYGDSGLTPEMAETLRLDVNPGYGETGHKDMLGIQ